MFCKKGILKNFAKLTGKHLCLSLFLIKLHAWLAALLKKRLWYKCFSVNFAKLLRTPFFVQHLRWLLLSDIYHNNDQNNCKIDSSVTRNYSQTEAAIRRCSQKQLFSLSFEVFPLQKIETRVLGLKLHYSGTPYRMCS